MRQTILWLGVAIALGWSALGCAAALKIYDRPADDARVMTTVASGQRLIPIFHTAQRDWIKVANPQNGEVGWVKAAEFKGTVIITEINGERVEQRIVADPQKPGTTSYSLIQYQNSTDLKPAELRQQLHELQLRDQKIRASLQRMQLEMQKSIHELFGDLERDLHNFSTGPCSQQTPKQLQKSGQPTTSNPKIPNKH